MKKTNNLWRIVTVISLILAVCSLVGVRYFGEKTEGVEDVTYATGNQNNCLCYDDTQQIMYVGTHDNFLIAFQEGQELFRVSAGGPFSEVTLDQENHLIYAGNEDGNIYVYDMSDGTLQQQIEVQRRIVSITVSSDHSKVAVATSTGSSKANILIYSTADGSEIANHKYTVSIAGVKFAEDGESLFSVNKRGEICRIAIDGSELNSYETNFAALSLIRQNDLLWTVCKDGSYYALDESLNVVRKGCVQNTVSATIVSIGTDEANEHVIVGTSEGYFFIMNGADQQVYMADVGTKITGFAGVENEIYMAGLADLIKLVHVDNLENIATNRLIANVLRIAGVILLSVTVIALVMSFGRSRSYILHLLKEIWKHRMAYIMLLPTLLLIYFFNYRGIATAFIRAFTNWSKTNTSLAQIDFVGLENFGRMFTEGYFLIGMKNLVLLMVTGIIKVLTMPLVIAWLVYNISGGKRKYLHRFLFVLPIVVPGVISAMTWQKIYDPSIGLLNEVLGALHLESLQHVWLGDSKTAIWAVIFMGFPFVHAMAFLVYYGGFLNIGRDVEESAMIDGATRWEMFWKIQLPLIRPQISIMVTLQIIGTMQDFNSIFILTGGGPGTATYVPALELYLNVAQFGRYGYACALGVILFVFTMTATLISNRLTREKE